MPNIIDINLQDDIFALNASYEQAKSETDALILELFQCAA